MLCIGGQQLDESELDELISPDSDEICDLEYVDWEIFNKIMNEPTEKETDDNKITS
jgi:hypothetical protein